MIQECVWLRQEQAGGVVAEIAEQWMSDKSIGDEGEPVKSEEEPSSPLAPEEATPSLLDILKSIPRTQILSEEEDVNNWIEQGMGGSHILVHQPPASDAFISRGDFGGTGPYP